MRKSSKHKPNKTLVNPLAYVLESLRPVADQKDSVLQLRLRNRFAIEALREGRATLEDMQTLIEVNNFVDRLISVGFGAEHKEVSQKGQQAIISLAQRNLAATAFGGNSDELLAITELIDLNDAQLDVITVRDVRNAELYAAKHSTPIRVTFSSAPAIVG